MKILNVPIKGQWYDFDCGIAITYSLLKYYKIKVKYEDVLKASKVCPVDGIKPNKLINLFKMFGLNAICENNKNIRFLIKKIKENNPVILLIQSRKEYKKRWGDSWINGHYVAVIGYDKNRLFILDPSMGGSIKTYTYRQIYNRWHDVSDENYYIRTVIYVKSKKQQ